MTTIVEMDAWNYEDFMINATSALCICGTHKAEPDKKKRKFDDIFLSAGDAVRDDEKIFAAGRSQKEIREWSRQQDAYRLAKILSKWKNFREPQFNWIFLLGKYLHHLLLSTGDQANDRLRNIHFCGLAGSTGKTSCMDLLMAPVRYGPAGPLEPNQIMHLIANITNERFGAHGCSECGQHRTFRVNECSVETLSGTGEFFCNEFFAMSFLHWSIVRVYKN